MLVLAEISGELIGLRVRERSIRRINLGPVAPVAREVDRAQRAHRSMSLNISTGLSEAHSRALHDAAASLDSMILAPGRLGDDPLVLVPPPSMQSMPWSAVPALRGRPLVISPSAFAWLRATTARSREGSTVLIAGPGLEQAHDEVEELARLYSTPQVLTGRDATVASVLEALDGANLAHFACHATFRGENAMFSSLRLADGDLSVYELEGTGNMPDIVVLSACDSGLSQAHAGEELTGLAVSLLGMGARSLIAANALVPDSGPTRSLMALLHKGLIAGAPPARALAEAKEDLDPDLPGAELTRRAFYCLGS